MTDLRNKAGWVLMGAAFFGAATMVFSQAAPGLSAREIFYSPVPQPAAAKTAAAPKSNSKPSTAKNQSGTAAAVKPTATAEAAKSNPPAAQAEPPAAPPIAAVSLVRYPLGVRFSIVKLDQGQQDSLQEMPLDTSFHPGDRVRLKVQASDSGYLYIIDRQSSGVWKPLFPSSDLPGASNAVVRGGTYLVPPAPGPAFLIGDPPGEEKLFIILSRTPQLDMQSLTLDMSRRDAKGPASNQPPQDSPAAARREPEPKIISQNLPPMNDDTVDQLRKFYARDLIVEKVDDQTPGASKENAVYAVNPGQGDDARVVLDAQIKHR